MFDQVFSNPYAQRRNQQAPFLSERVRFLKHHADVGASKDTLQQIAAYQLVVIDRLKLRPDGLIEPGDIQSAAGRWVGRKFRHPRRSDGSRGHARFVSVATRWLDFIGRLAKPDELNATNADVLERWIDHMRNEKGLTPITIEQSRTT